MLKLLSAIPEPAGRTRSALAPFSTFLESSLAATSLLLKLPASVESELFSLIGTSFYVPLILSAPHGTETVFAYFEAGVLRCTRAPEGYYFAQGACVSAPIAGLQGAPGVQGAQGAQGSGLTGSQGAQGSAGSIGNTGQNGADGLSGSRIFGGTGAPLSTIGATIDYYIDFNTGDLYAKGTGAWIVVSSLKGPGGSDGTDGSEWFNGTGAPAPSLGAVNDFYINTNNGDLYKKAGGTWGVIANIKGPEGVFGNNGTPGSRIFFGTAAPSDTFGTTIDHYLDVNDGDWYVKSSGSWEVAGSIRGVPGTDGSNGAPGYSQSMHVWFTANNVYTARLVHMPIPDNTLRYNDIEGSLLPGGGGTVTFNPGTYMVFGSAEMVVSFASAYTGVTPSLSVVADVLLGTTWNVVEEWSTFGCHLMHNSTTDFSNLVVPHGVIDLPDGGGFRLRILGDWDSAIPTAAVSAVVKLTIIRLQ